MFHKTRKLLILVLLIGTSGVTWAQDNPVTFVTSAEKEEAYTDKQGIQRTRLVPAATIIPGDSIVYTITFSNKGKKTVNGVSVVDPIPDQMRYVTGSAFGPGTAISFSADNGKSYGNPDTVMIKGTDGQLRVAAPAEYTHIRWQLKNPLEPDNQAYAQFKAVLK